MRLSRMLEIVTILLNKKTVTAAELADRFGVSVRTIYRDIDVLSSSGVPVFTTQGINGGISIMEEYTMSRIMLSESDKNSILFALQSLRSTKFPEAGEVLEKLGSLLQSSISDWIRVDFSPWGSDSNLQNKFVEIKNAILNSRVIEIDYINMKNQKSTRRIEPLRLEFKSQAWYIWGWCQSCESFRSFRISRIKRLTAADETFDRMRERIPMKQEESGDHGGWQGRVHCVLQFTGDALYRLYDDYDDNDIYNNGDGTFTLEMDLPEGDWVYGYILSFGPYVKVIEPEHIQKIIREKAERIIKRYDS